MAWTSNCRNYLSRRIPRVNAARPAFAAALTGGLLLAGSPAFAAAYYSKSSPLTAWEGGVAQAQAYGYMSVKDSTFLHNSTNHRDPRPGGDAAFHVTDYRFEVQTWEGKLVWHPYRGDDRSADTRLNEWFSQTDSYNYAQDGEPNRGRIRAKVCEDQAWSIDPCSDEPYQTFNL